VISILSRADEDEGFLETILFQM